MAALPVSYTHNRLRRNKSSSHRLTHTPYAIVHGEPLETALPPALLKELGALHSRHALAGMHQADGVEDQGSSNNKNARPEHVLTQLIHATTSFQIGDIHPYTIMSLIMSPIAPDARSFFMPGVDHTVYLSRQIILQHICPALHLPINSIHTIYHSNGNFEGTSAIPRFFHGDHMSTEYAAMESASESIIRFLCTHKNVKVDDMNHAPKQQVEQLYAASVTYQQHHQGVARKGVASDQLILAEVQGSDWQDQVCICIKSAALLPINHMRICGPIGDLTVTLGYAGKKTLANRRRKLAGSFTCLLGHKRDTVPSSVRITMISHRKRQNILAKCHAGC